jgi:hypothetical protein
MARVSATTNNIIYKTNNTFQANNLTLSKCLETFWFSLEKSC